MPLLNNAKLVATKYLKSSGGINIEKLLSEPAEAAVNALHIGKELNVPIGTKYPGKQEALKFFEKASTSEGLATSRLNDYNWREKPKRVWDAITGKYYMLPLVIGSIINKNE